MLNVFPSNTDVVVGDVDDEMLQVPQVTETQKKQITKHMYFYKKHLKNSLGTKKKTGQTY